MMREWDEMIARQVSADGVRTTWGEHVAPPGGEVTMTDDRILSVEEVRYLPAWKQATAIRLARSHEALRARLTAAEAERDQAIRTREEVAQAWARRRDQAERHAAQVAALTEALREYGHHNGSCAYSGIPWGAKRAWRDGVERPCTCGLSAALAAADQEDTDGLG